MKLSDDPMHVGLPDDRPTTTGQAAMWFLQEIMPDSSSYNVVAAFRLHFPVDSAVLAEAVTATVARHEVLRSAFRPVGSEVRRIPLSLPESSLMLKSFDVADLDHQTLRAFAQTLAEQPFTLGMELPLRCSLLRGSAARPDVLLVVAHHIVTDDISQLALTREILTRYSALMAGRVVTESDGVPTFDEFVERQRAYLDSPEPAVAQAYWEAELSGFDVGSDVLTDLPRPARYGSQGSEIVFTIPDDLAQRLKTDAAARGVTEFAYLMSLFQLLLYRHSGRTEFVVGYPVSQRPGRRFRETVGYFINTLPLRAALNPDASFEHVLRHTAERLWSALKHRDYPLAHIARTLHVPPDPARCGLIQVMITTHAPSAADPFFAATLTGAPFEHAGLEISWFDVPQQHGQTDLMLDVFRHGPGVYGKFKFNTDLFAERTVRRLAHDYLDLLAKAVGHTLPATLCELRMPASPNPVTTDH